MIRIDADMIMEQTITMKSTVTTKNMTSIPAGIARAIGIEPGWKLDWALGAGEDEILIKAIPGRGERARRLMGRGRSLAQGRDIVAELVQDRKEEADR
jgi:hypothetical protein